MPQIKPSKKEIDDALQKCFESESSGQSVFPGMTYEQGVESALNWVLGDTDIDPFED